MRSGSICGRYLLVDFLKQWSTVAQERSLWCPSVNEYKMYMLEAMSCLFTAECIAVREAIKCVKMLPSINMHRLPKHNYSN